MAKKDKSTPTLPKRLAGVKIPKEVRDSLVKLAKHPMVADLLAAGLVALAASLRDKPEGKKAVSKAKAKVAETAEQVSDATAEIAAAVATKAVASVRKAANKSPAVRKAAKSPTLRKAATAVMEAAKAAADAPAPAAPKPAKAPKAAAKPAPRKPAARKPAGSPRRPPAKTTH